MKPHFWITNISDRRVCLADLLVDIPPKSSVNLLDKKHYNYTEEQLVKSATSGSIYKKRDKIIKRIYPPGKPMQPPVSMEKVVIASKRKFAVVVEEPNYDELDLTTDKFAEEAADLTDK